MTESPAHPDRPNILLINCDDLGYGDLGCYGSSVNRTPALDRLAAEGVRFTDFYMASPVSSPSRAAMLTGCYPPRIGFGKFRSGWVLFPGDPEGLHPDELTIADLLRRQGYATMLVGKWHCGDQPDHLPLRHGFDHYFGLPYSNDMGRQADRSPYPPLPLIRDREVLQQQPDQASLTERYLDAAVRFIRDHRRERFFLYFAHMYVHRPIYAPERFLRQSINGRYGAAVECIDWTVSVLMRELADLGIDRHTLVVFTSDNGSRCNHEGGSNAPLRGTKGTTWEGGTRLPCIARWPGVIPPGITCRQPAASIDFLPTFARLAGTAEPNDRVIDGKDIRPLLLGSHDHDPSRSPERPIYYYFQNDLHAVRRGRWKLWVRDSVRRTDKPGRQSVEIQRLYDLQTDPGESADLASQHPEVVAGLREEVRRMHADLGCDASGIPGANRRPVGLASDPVPLTRFDPSYPYFAAEYDLPDAG